MGKKDILHLNRLMKEKKQLGFIVFFCFLISFVSIRLFTAYIAIKYNLFFYIGEYHIHHFYMGFGLIILATWMAIFSFRDKFRYLAAAIYGIGLGIFVDEIGLLMSEMTEYWAQESYTAFVILCLTILTLMFLDRAWIKSELKKIKIG